MLAEIHIIEHSASFNSGIICGLRKLETAMPTPSPASFKKVDIPRNCLFERFSTFVS